MSPDEALISPAQQVLFGFTDISAERDEEKDSHHFLQKECLYVFYS